MNKDERSAASTGADTERHRSNDLNPTSAPALSLPPQRLGSAMEGLAERLPEWLRDQALEREKNDAHQLFPHGAAILRRWASEVEALRQRPGAQAASEPSHAAMQAEVARLRAAIVAVTRESHAATRGILDLHIIAGEADAHPAGERPAQAEPMTETLALYERLAKRAGELWERCQGKFWPDAESDEFVKLRDEQLPALRASILATLTARERPGAQAPSTADADVMVNGLTRAETEATASVFGLAAPSTGGAETAELDNRRDAFEGYLRSQGFEPRRNGFGYHGNNGHDWLTWLAAIRASSAPAQAVEQEVERQIAAAVSRAGLTLLKKADGYEVRKLGPIVAQGSAVETAGARHFCRCTTMCFKIPGCPFLDTAKAALQSPAASPASKEDGKC